MLRKRSLSLFLAYRTVFVVCAPNFHVFLPVPTPTRSHAAAWVNIVTDRGQASQLAYDSTLRFQWCQENQHIVQVNSDRIPFDKWGNYAVQWEEKDIHKLTKKCEKWYVWVELRSWTYKYKQTKKKHIQTVGEIHCNTLVPLQANRLKFNYKCWYVFVQSERTISLSTDIL